MQQLGPDKNTFIKIYNEVQGDYQLFNDILCSIGQEPLSGRTFRRRRLEWIGRIHSDDTPRYNPTANRVSKEDTRPIAGGTIDPPDNRRGVLTGKCFVFTSAQNNTYVHKAFWRNLLAFCEHREAQLVVGRFTYNRNGFQNSSKDLDDDLWYDPKLAPYFVDESMRLESSRTGTVWCGELDIIPTTDRPLNGFDNYTHTASSIIPHAKVQMQSVPVLKGYSKKMLYTTGACTQRNYIQRKSGQKAEFHHVFGALLVEFDLDGREFRRQLIADSKGTFYDLTEKFENGEVTDGHHVEAINWGDIHAELLDPVVADVSWRLLDSSMLDTLKPKYQFVHDLTDFHARNHHNIGNPHALAERYYNGTSSVQDGMRKSGDLLGELSRAWSTTVVVESNHDQAFRRWLAEANIYMDIENAEYFHRCNAEVFKQIREGKKPQIFEYAIRQEVPLLQNTMFLPEDESFVICGDENGIECGMHGHRGPNGARGNPNSLRKLGRKANIGHTHSAGIIDGVYVAGISCKEDLGYNVGPSSWSHSHIVTYPNGKRTIITIDKGKWRA